MASAPLCFTNWKMMRNSYAALQAHEPARLPFNLWVLSFGLKASSAATPESLEGLPPHRCSFASAAWPNGRRPWWAGATVTSQDFLHDLARRRRSAPARPELLPRLIDRRDQFRPTLLPQPALKNRDEALLFIRRKFVRPFEHLTKRFHSLDDRPGIVRKQADSGQPIPGVSGEAKRPPARRAIRGQSFSTFRERFGCRAPLCEWMNMKMNQFVLASLAGGLLCVNAHSAGAADSGSGTPGVATQRAVVNFAELARQVAPPAAAPPEAAPAAQARFAPASMGGTPPSPSPASSFLAFNQEQGISYVPDTQGAVGPKHLMVAVNGTLRIQDRLGGVISTVADTNFWANLGIFPGNSTCGPNTEFPIFDPRILYDPFGQRWILTSLSDAITNAASLLIGVSQTSDPTGNWNLYRIYLDSPRQQWMDFDRLGFTKDWIVVCGAMFAGYYLPT